jgi:hypothetical protein
MVIPFQSTPTRKMAADLPPLLVDLLEIAAYVYSADQAVPKGGTQSFDYGNSWDRSLRFRIAVRCPVGKRAAG